ncbi:tol-pal system protein YbgF [Maridesulfovibrio frigidus]|uniref:tol-pal system protein YbgF n=1 Tax=Maridesulfovibrio frigidus TaxID=340956 RepID=UPI0004E10716|nr:tol-pal system protein YbgF [Maridesulfovibrio frigidus]
MKKNSFKKSLISGVLILIAAVGLAGLSGCVTTSDMDSLRLEVRQSRSQLNKKIDTLDQQMNQADTSIRDEIKTSSTPVQNRQANIWAEVNTLKIEVAKIQGSLDTLATSMYDLNGGDSNSTVSLNELTQQFYAMRMALESQLDMNLDLIQPHPETENKYHKAVSATTPAPVGIAAVVTPVVKKEAPADPAKALYNKALELFKVREYKKAIVDWSEFTKAFPKNSLVPNAIFWKGECYYQLKDYPNAALKYQVIIGKYPKSNKYNSAMLKQGLSLIKLGKTKSGKYILEDLVKKAPDSLEAKRAKQYLKNLK